MKLPHVRWIVLGIVAAGVTLRLRQYFAVPSLWIDEAMLALNVGSRSFAELLERLDYAQTAPIPFLWVLRGATHLAGVQELALRALPLAAGLAFLPVLWLVARRLLDPEAALFATAIAALSPLLIRYSNELKPYSTEALVAVVLLYLTLNAVEEPNSAQTRRLLLGAGCISILVATTAILVLAGMGLALWAASGKRRAEGVVRHLSFALIVWSVLFAVTYVAVYRAAASSPYSQRYWAPSFLWPSTPDSRRAIIAAIRDAIDALFFGRQPGLVHLGLSLVAVVLLGLGIAHLARARGWWAGWLLAGPLAMTFAASAVRKYPLSARTLVFAAPFLILPVAAGLSQATRALPHRFRLPGYAALAALLLSSAARFTFARARSPAYIEHARPAVAELERRAAAGEPVYVHNNGIPAWAFYTTEWDAPDTARLKWLSRNVSPGGAAYYNTPSRGREVNKEGEELVYRHRERQELFGIPTGMQMLSHGFFVRSAPDLGWAENEADRIRAAAGPCIWLFFARSRPTTRPLLLQRLASVGGNPDYKRSWPGVWIYHYCFR